MTNDEWANGRMGEWANFGGDTPPLQAIESDYRRL
jgi:hypothetical protein